MRIMILTNSPKTNSGYSNISNNLYFELRKLGYDVAMTGLQTSHEMEVFKKIPVYPVMDDFHEAQSIQAQIHRLKRNMADHKSEALLCIFQGDSLLNPFTQVHSKTYWYLPLEGELVFKNHPCFAAARKVHQLVTMTHSAEKQFNRQGIANKCIYLGHDPKVFRKGYNKNIKEPVMIYFPAKNEEVVIPVNALQELKERMGIKYMMTFVAQNFGIKKRFERLIEAFSIFAKDKTNTHLHLHTLPVHIKGLNLLELLDYYNVKDKVTFSYGNFRSSGWSPEALNVLYNMTDVYVSASSGEGFGLPHLESMAAGVPQIAPDVEPFREFFGYDDEKRGLLAKSTGQMTQAGEIRGLVDVRNLAEKMETYYARQDFREHVGRNCQKWAEQYTWQQTAKQFDQVLKA